MVTGKEVATHVDDRGLALRELETRFELAVKQRELLESYIKRRLTPDKHFYTVGDDPKRKPSLTKEGAELICLPHNLKPRYAIIFGPENPPMDDAPYQITVNCEMVSGDRFGGQGLGSANSMITKKDGTRVPRQPDPGLRHNATLKMACKSSYIAATLNATAASEFFTQDLEDDQTGSIEKPESKGHWCAVHKCVFFKRGKMKSFAHPIGDTGEWCHEHSAEPPPPGAAKPPAESSATAQAEGSPPASKPKAESGDNEKVDGIDMDWLAESLKMMPGWKAGAWLHEHYPEAEGQRVRDIVKNLRVDQRMEFGQAVLSRRELL